MRIRKVSLIRLPQYDCITFKRPAGNGIYDVESWIINKDQIQEDKDGMTNLVIPIDEIEELETEIKL